MNRERFLTFTVNVNVVWELKEEAAFLPLIKRLNIKGPAKLPGQIGPITIELKKKENE